jgi:hypothetical protein
MCRGGKDTVQCNGHYAMNISLWVKFGGDKLFTVIFWIVNFLLTRVGQRLAFTGCSSHK